MLLPDSALPLAAPTRALSVHPLWADLIAAGIKPIENRSWPTSYRGWIAIHATRPRQQLIAVAFLEEIYRPDELTPALRRWATGPHCWHLSRVVAVGSPVCCSGRQGLWTLPDSVVAALARQLPG